MRDVGVCVWGAGCGCGAGISEVWLEMRLGRPQGRRQLHGDVVVAAGGTAARARGGVAAHHHAAPHHLQPAPCNTPHIAIIVLFS